MSQHSNYLLISVDNNDIVDTLYSYSELENYLGENLIHNIWESVMDEVASMSGPGQYSDLYLDDGYRSIIIRTEDS